MKLKVNDFTLLVVSKENGEEKFIAFPKQLTLSVEMPKECEKIDILLNLNDEGEEK